MQAPFKIFDTETYSTLTIVTISTDLKFSISSNVWEVNGWTTILPFQQKNHWWPYITSESVHRSKRCHRNLWLQLLIKYITTWFNAQFSVPSSVWATLIYLIAFLAFAVNIFFYYYFQIVFLSESRDKVIIFLVSCRAAFPFPADRTYACNISQRVVCYSWERNCLQV